MKNRNRILRAFDAWIRQPGKPLRLEWYAFSAWVDTELIPLHLQNTGK